jgi:signal transduction histidine kinase/PAS domain-containing protein
MATKDLPPGGLQGREDHPFIQEALEALLEMTGATAGWVGLAKADGALHFPARCGKLPEGWLSLQQGQAAVWGVDIREGPALLNELPPLPWLGEPPLSNLLSCLLWRESLPLGQLVLANKPNGFMSHDALALQTAAHLLSRFLQGPLPSGPVLPPLLLRLCLDRTHEGTLVVSHAGQLLFANATWSQWTGFSVEELIGRSAPFPFWIGHRELATLGGPALALPTAKRAPDVRSLQMSAVGPGQLSYLPFRHRNHSLFWCQVETLAEEIDGQAVTLAFLRRLPAAGPSAVEPDGSAFSFHALAEELPFAVALTDRFGQVLWANTSLVQEWKPAFDMLGQPVTRLFAPAGAAALERLIREAASAADQDHGCLVLQRLGRERDARDLVTYWQRLVLPQGPGFLFAFAEDWEAIGRVAGATIAKSLFDQTRALVPDSLALLFRPGAPVELWDERWEQMTGMRQADLAGEAGELVLDWLFPRQHDRERVADLLHEPSRRGAQALLDVAGRTGSRSLLCTFVPIQIKGQKDWPFTPGLEAWLILVQSPPLPATEETVVQRFLRQISRGLAHLLNNYLTLPIGLAELALDRSDLPADLASSFSQILESCMRAGRLVAALQDLAAETPGDKQQVSLALFVRDFLEEQAAMPSGPRHELRFEMRDTEALVEVNPRMLKVILEHLLTNAVQALAGRGRREIHVKVSARDGEVRCEFRDTGAGLPVSDWTAALAPFYSTKGSFARDASQRSIDALGLGLTVSQHLLALHGGRLELHSVQGEGTTAVVILPRAGGVPAGRDPFRTSGSASLAGPHLKKREDVESKPVDP